MSLGERIKELRKVKNLTQQEFANQIGTTRNNIAGYETGRREPSAAVVNLIIAKLNVSESWLRIGEGEMFIQKKPRPLDELLSALLGGETVTDEDRVLVKNFLELPDASRKAVIEFVKKSAAELSAPPLAAVAKNETTTPALDTLGQERRELDWRGQEIDMEAIDKQVELYRRQLLSEQEQAKQALSANGSGAG